MEQPVYTYKKLNYLYTVHDVYTAGIMLEGWEVKSLRDHRGNIETAYCAMKGNNFCLINSKITPLENHVLNDIASVKESRDRVLLLNKAELNKILDKISTKGWTCVPSKLYYTKNRLWKVDIALVTGNKIHDNRERIKTRDLDRGMRRELGE